MMINIAELSKQIHEKNMKKLYVFTGVEFTLMNMYIDRIVAGSGLVLSRIDSLLSIFSKLQNKTIFETAKCYVIREDREYVKQDTVWEKLILELVQGDNILIFIYDKIDARGKFYKAHENNIVEFQKLSEDILCKHIIKDMGISNVSAKKLASMCSLDYGRILNESDKIKTLAKCLSITNEAAFHQAVLDKLIYEPPGDIIFDFIDSVLLRNVTTAHYFLSQIKLQESSPLGAIALLYNNFRSMLLVQSLGKTQNISEITGLTSWQIMMIKEKIGKYSISELTSSLRVVRETEKGIKVGTIDAAMALDFILIKVLS